MQKLFSSSAFRQKAEQLAEVVRFFAAKGWSPATSCNFSFRVAEAKDVIAISRSGIDKYYFTAEDLMLVDSSGSPLYPENAKPSAETLIHTTLYQFPEVHCVLHTHSVQATVLSRFYMEEGKITFSNYEILKGLQGNKTHNLQENLPIFANSQDMQQFSANLDKYLQGELAIHGFLIAGHGLYTWGKNLFTAKRHIETWEYLLECKALEQKSGC